MVHPGFARASEVLDARPDQAEPGATYVVGRIAVAVGEVVVDAGRDIQGGGLFDATVVAGGEEVVRVGEVGEARGAARVGVGHVQRLLPHGIRHVEHDGAR